jgi:uncharacterized membrane protein YbaN (DUF454 family)
MFAHARVHSLHTAAHRAMLTRAARIGWLVVGFVALALGALGIALPLLPTTPFVLVAAFAFAQSSEKLHQWLVNHDVFGTLIDNWQRYGAISRRAKVISVLSMAAVLAISLAMGAPAGVIIVQLVVLGGAALFILSRPAPPPPAPGEGGSEPSPHSDTDIGP